MQQIRKKIIFKWNLYCYSNTRKARVPLQNVETSIKCLNSLIDIFCAPTISQALFYTIGIYWWKQQTRYLPLQSL